MRIARSRVVIGFVFAVITTATSTAQSVDITPRIVQPPLSGRDTFKFYCAPCHGVDGKGKGPVAAALKGVPADLTRLASGNRGIFPLERVRAFIASGSSNAPAHGTSDMPVWGPIFQSLDPSDKTAAVRIDNVVDYIRSLQAP